MPSHPSYGHICKRVNKLNNICINNNRCNLEDDDLIIAIDSTGIKITNTEGNGCKINGIYRIRARRKKAI